MSDEARDRNDQRVRGPQQRVWLIAVIALFAGIVIGAVLWAIVMRSKFDWSWSGWPTIIALITLGGILITALATVVLASSTRTLAQYAQDQAKTTNQELEIIGRQLQVAKEQAAHIRHVGDLAVYFQGIVVGFVGGAAAAIIKDAVKSRLSRRQQS